MDRSDGSFPAFVTEAAPQLRATAFLVTGHRGDAGALTTAALAATHRRWRRLTPATTVPAARAALVHAVLVHSATDPGWPHRSADLTGAETVASGADDGSTASGSVDGLTAADVDHNDLDDDDRAWLTALTGLPLRARLALVLRLHDGLADDEVAALLSTDEDTVAGLVLAAVRDLGPLLADDRLPVPSPAAAGAVVVPAVVVPAVVVPAAAVAEEDGDSDPYAVYRRPR
ncbi:hypothetical protein [Modestobacter sp. NPDC049651]|uniref:hypothetical protein n=1 Tax=unclassified Modestobacter TaxID=2643866 RepID=UPI0033FC6BB4